MLKQKIEKIKSLGSNMELTSWRQYDSLMGIKPRLISMKISANGISKNQPRLLSVHVVGLEHEISVKKQAWGGHLKKIRTNLLESHLPLYFSLHVLLT
jgi:hypothetical protein